MRSSGGGWIATYREAVIVVLAQRQVADTDVDAREICLPVPSCIIRDSTRTYHAVMVCRDIVSYGRATCYDQRGDCYLGLATFGIGTSCCATCVVSGSCGSRWCVSLSIF